jgi:hypothetical protein
MDVEYDFYCNNCLILRQTHFIKFTKIILKIEFNETIDVKSFHIETVLSSIKLVIGNTIVDNIDNTKLKMLYNKCNWINNCLFIEVPLTYSNGVVIFDECKYFEIKIIKEEPYYVHWNIKKYSCIIHYE